MNDRLLATRFRDQSVKRHIALSSVVIILASGKVAHHGRPYTVREKSRYLD